MRVILYYDNKHNYYNKQSIKSLLKAVKIPHNNTACFLDKEQCFEATKKCHQHHYCMKDECKCMHAHTFYS